MAPGRLANLSVGFDSHGAERDGEGNATYARNLVSALLLASRTDEFVLYAQNPDHAFYRSLSGRGLSRVVRTTQWNGFARVVYALGRAASRDCVDVLHVQYFAPLWFRGPLVVTVHDLAFRSVPETFPPRLRAALRMLVPLSIRRAARVITGSEFARRDILTSYSISPERVTVIPHGVDGRFYPRTDGESTGILARYGLRPGFLFSVGRLNERKNITRLLEAYACLRRRGATLPLVIGGKPDGGVESGQRASEATDVRWMGLIPNEDLPAFYSGAAAFIYPSLFEGFGLPVLEAMACGTPVVTSDRAALPELATDAALLVDPEDVGALADAMERVLTDTALAQELRQRGMARSQRFTWAETAARTLAIYREVSRGERGDRHKA